MDESELNLYDNRFSILKEEIISRIDMSRDVSDDEIKDIIKDTIYELRQKENISLAEREELFRLLFYEV